MAQTLAVVAFFIAIMAALPWLVRRAQMRQGGTGSAGAALRVLSQTAIGPQQRVLALEINDQGQRTVLVLGVTAQQVQCLHVLGSTAPSSIAQNTTTQPPEPGPVADFATQMAVVQRHE